MPRWTRLGEIRKLARSSIESKARVKLTQAAAVPTMGAAAGESEVRSSPRGRSRGKKPASQAAQWQSARLRLTRLSAGRQVFA